MMENINKFASYLIRSGAKPNALEVKDLFFEIVSLYPNNCNKCLSGKVKGFD